MNKRFRIWRNFLLRPLRRDRSSSPASGACGRAPCFGRVRRGRRAPCRRGVCFGGAVGGAAFYACYGGGRAGRVSACYRGLWGNVVSRDDGRGRGVSGLRRGRMAGYCAGRGGRVARSGGRRAARRAPVSERRRAFQGSYGGNRSGQRTCVRDGPRHCRLRQRRGPGYFPDGPRAEPVAKKRPVVGPRRTGFVQRRDAGGGACGRRSLEYVRHLFRRRPGWAA